MTGSASLKLKGHSPLPAMVFLLNFSEFQFCHISAGWDMGCQRPQEPTKIRGLEKSQLGKEMKEGKLGILDSKKSDIREGKYISSCGDMNEKLGRTDLREERKTRIEIRREAKQGGWWKNRNWDIERGGGCKLEAKLRGGVI